jgi:hypothetical protein
MVDVRAGKLAQRVAATIAVPTWSIRIPDLPEHMMLFMSRRRDEGRGAGVRAPVELASVWRRANYETGARVLDDGQADKPADAVATFECAK